MELDLITALTAPKPDMAGLPKLGAIPATEVFTAFVQDETHEDPPSELEPPALEGPQKLPLVLPHSSQKGEAAEVRISEEMAPPNSISTSGYAPETATYVGFGAVEITASRPSNQALPEVRIARVIAPASNLPPPRPVGVETTSKIVEKPVQVALFPAASATPITLSNPVTAAPVAPQSGQQTAPAMQHIFTATDTTELASSPFRPEANIAPQKAELPIKEEVLRPVSAQTVTPQTPPTQTAVSAPVLQAQFANIEQVHDDLAEVQFSIKMASQSADTVQITRATAPPAPIATQISAQLPQLIAKAEKQTIELRLDPPELGRVTIQLTTHDHQVTAQVVAERVSTVELMRQHADLLTNTLARAGFSQADLSFQHGSGKNGQEDNLQFQSITGASESETSAAAPPTLTGQNGRLDIRL